MTAPSGTLRQQAAGWALSLLREHQPDLEPALTTHPRETGVDK